jgi:hypothetical protein
MDWNEGLKLVSYCPVCETRYNAMEARHMGQDGDTHLLHVTCRKCGNAILAMVLLNRVGASSVGLITDLTSDDVMRFRSSGSVSIDDVIEMHSFAEKEGWKALLRTARKPRVRAKAVKPRKT